MSLCSNLIYFEFDLSKILVFSQDFRFKFAFADNELIYFECLIL